LEVLYMGETVRDEGIEHPGQQSGEMVSGERNDEDVHSQCGECGTNDQCDVVG
jgi:hypothetical protein